MTTILFHGLDLDISRRLKTILEKIGHEVYYNPHKRLLDNYEEWIPDVVILGFYHQEATFEMLQQVVEFDGSCCIFVLVDTIDPYERDLLYKAGTRVVMEMPVVDNLDGFMNQLFSACSDLRNESCLGCWKFSRFELLDILM